MKVPRVLREQLSIYERAGFTPKSITPGSKHFRVEFNEFPQVQTLTKNVTDPRSFKNNLAQFKRLASAHQLKEKS